MQATRVIRYTKMQMFSVQVVYTKSPNASEAFCHKKISVWRLSHSAMLNYAPEAPKAGDGYTASLLR